MDRLTDEQLQELFSFYWSDYSNWLDIDRDMAGKVLTVIAELRGLRECPGGEEDYRLWQLAIDRNNESYAKRRDRIVERLTDEQLEECRALEKAYREIATDTDADYPRGNGILLDVATGRGHYRLYLNDFAALIAEVDALRAELAARRPPVVCVAVHHGNSTIASILEA